MAGKRKTPDNSDKSLAAYSRKRNFERTAEPTGTQKPQPASQDSPSPARPHRLYVIHKHDASRLHYDFRIELDGVLKSWAVPKGPCLDPSQKRLAVHVEDHPIEYGSFEGTIPEGEYGGGTVMLWDRGWWEPAGDGDPGEDYDNGTMKFLLHGEKLNGTWKLVRFRGRSDEGENWLLIKSRDEHARPLAEFDILKAAPDSVATGRSLEQIANGLPPAGPA